MEGGKEIGRRIFRVSVWIATVVIIAVVIQKMRHWMAESGTFRLQNVQIVGTRLLQTADILDLMELDPEMQLTALDLERIQQKLEAHPYIASAVVSRRFPGTLHVELVERKPVAFLVLGKLYAVDRDGVILPVLHTKALGELPVLTGLRDIEAKPGEAARSEVLTGALELLEAVQIADFQLYQRVSEVHFDFKKGFIVYLKNPKLPLYFGREEFLARARKASLFLKALENDRRRRRARYVDLRFDQQVVAKFSNSR